MILKNKIKKIINAIKDTDINEIEISSFWGFQKIKLKKGVDYTSSIEKPVDVVKQDEYVENHNEQTAEETIKTEVEDKDEIYDDFEIIKAPLVGTYYQSQKPGDPAFVELGNKINIGDTICIIEAMKIFNDIDSEYAGVIKEILVNDGEPVEFDQPLFKIQKV